MYHNSVSDGDIPLSDGRGFSWQCVQELLVWDLIIPAALVIMVFIVSMLIRLIIELKEDKDEQ